MSRQKTRSQLQKHIFSSPSTALASSVYGKTLTQLKYILHISSYSSKRHGNRNTPTEDQEPVSRRPPPPSLHGFFFEKKSKNPHTRYSLFSTQTQKQFSQNRKGRWTHRPRQCGRERGSCCNHQHWDLSRGSPRSRVANVCNSVRCNRQRNRSRQDDRRR